MSCPKLCCAGLALLLGYSLVFVPVHNTYTQTQAFLRREAYIDNSRWFALNGSDTLLVREMELFEDPCYLYQRSHTLLRIAYARNWTQSIAKAKELVMNKYPADSEESKTYKICPAICNPRWSIGCYSDSQWTALIAY